MAPKYKNSNFFQGIAAQEGHELCVVSLLEHGADPNHSDACGRNALRVAAKSGHRGVVRLLEEYNIRSHKITHNSSSTNSITSGTFSLIPPSIYNPQVNFFIQQHQPQKQNPQQRSSTPEQQNGPSNSVVRASRSATTVPTVNPVRI